MRNFGPFLAQWFFFPRCHINSSRNRTNTFRRSNSSADPRRSSFLNTYSKLGTRIVVQQGEILILHKYTFSKSVKMEQKREKSANFELVLVLGV